MRSYYGNGNSRHTWVCNHCAGRWPILFYHADRQFVDAAIAISALANTAILAHEPRRIWPGTLNAINIFVAVCSVPRYTRPHGHVESATDL